MTKAQAIDEAFRCWWNGYTFKDKTHQLFVHSDPVQSILFNYKTPILTKEAGKITLDLRRYSKTTSRLQRQLHQLLTAKQIEFATLQDN